MAKKVGYYTVLSHLWIQWIILGSILLNTFMVYPNIFHNVPFSLEQSMDWMAVASPHTYFPPLGFVSILTGVLAGIFVWKVKSARKWVLLSLLAIILEGAASILFEWPRNEIMFIEGADLHSIEFLKQTVKEFKIVHWFRVICNIFGSLFIFIGFIRLDRFLTADKGYQGEVSN
ncbi:hypothetical protein [Bacillus infantis]|uniref:hypothetical protein n=1 Tax=Bacillus infantis TaxID=324767 RepID=UPI000B9BAADC|nr:hypothetical protein [Bacillus infantis]MCK6208674.1 hypothetical protein [Bacillus infantis]OXT14739.1 hypothetical protein B9K06_24645 [Bacillus sp. OG2]